MKRTKFTFLLLLISTILPAQNLKGVWEGFISSDPNSAMTYYNLINQGQVLIISLENDSIVSIGINLVGFSEKKEEILLIQDLKDDGRYLCMCNKLNNDSLDCIFPSINLIDSSYFFSGTDVIDYNKVDFLPINTFKLLYRQWGSQNRELFDKFTNKKTKTLITRALVFKSPNTPTKMYLIKGDAVEVVKEQGDWLSIKYYPEKDGKWTGRIIEGWIKKSDVE